MRPWRSRHAARALTSGVVLQPEARRRVLQRCVAKRFAALCILLTGCRSLLLRAHGAVRGLAFFKLPLILNNMRTSPRVLRAPWAVEPQISAQIGLLLLASVFTGR